MSAVEYEVAALGAPFVGNKEEKVSVFSQAIKDSGDPWLLKTGGRYMPHRAMQSAAAALGTSVNRVVLAPAVFACRERGED